MSGVADIAIQTPDSMIAAANTERLPIKIFHNLLPRSSYEIAVKPGAGVAGRRATSRARSSASR